MALVLLAGCGGDGSEPSADGGGDAQDAAMGDDGTADYGPPDWSSTPDEVQGTDAAGPDAELPGDTTLDEGVVEADEGSADGVADAVDADREADATDSLDAADDRSADDGSTDDGSTGSADAEIEPDVHDAEEAGPGDADAGDVQAASTCGVYASCLAQSSDDPDLCGYLIFEAGCQLCRLDAALACGGAKCGISAAEVACSAECMEDLTWSACLNSCMAKWKSACLTAYADDGSCNDENALCDLPAAPAACDSCAELSRECVENTNGPHCGGCLPGLTEWLGSCVAMPTCETGCGPHASCQPETGACACDTGWAMDADTDCVDALITNAWVPVLGPDDSVVFWQGSHGRIQSFPCHTVTVGHDYEMLRYEVSRAEYQHCVHAGACPAVEGDCGGEAPLVVDFDDPAYADHPATCVNFYAANDYCGWLGARLPSESEWELAARGPNDDCPWTDNWYPWGTDTLDSRAANYSGSLDPFEPPDVPWDTYGGPTTPVGFYDGSLRMREDAGWIGGPFDYQTLDNASPYGLYDMGGNVNEWVLDAWHEGYFGDYPTDGSPWLTVVAPGYGTLKGGSWFGHPDTLSTFYKGKRGYHDGFAYVGFRCARSVERPTFE